MRKHILPALLLGAIFMTAPTQNSNAQISNDRGTFGMPKQGDILIETEAVINFNGGGLFSLNSAFLSNLNSGLSTGVVAPGFSGSNYFPLLKARVYGRNNMVQRFFINISNSSQRLTDSNDNDYTSSSTGVALGWGMEKNFNAAERLNTYVGFDIMLGMARISSKVSDPDYKVKQMGFGAALKGFTGADYYVLPKVYLGIELGWGLGFNHYGSVDFDGTDDDVTSSDMTITPFITPVFRLGYVLCGKRMHGNGQPVYRSNESTDDDE